MHSTDDTDATTVVDVPAADHPTEEHVHLPPLSIWPITTAGGVALGGLGMATDYPLWILGLVVMGFGLVGWIQELRHEPH